MNSTKTLVVVIMGSKRDLGHAQEITAMLDQLGITHELRIASAHKSAAYLLNLLSEYETSCGRIIYIAVAGRSNALAGMVDANVSGPVITCPPMSSTFGGADIYSSLRMPSGVSPMVVLEPKAAGLAAAKCFALSDPGLRERIRAFQGEMSTGIVEDDQVVRNSGDAQ